MPKATVSQDTVRKELKSLPGGYVELRKLPFGLLLERRDNASKMSMSGGAGSDNKVDIALMQRWSRQFEFANCITDHNLEDDNGTKLNFNNELSLHMLDPKIGQEIEKYLDELNGEEDEKEKKAFPGPSSVSSPKEIREDKTLT